MVGLPRARVLPALLALPAVACHTATAPATADVRFKMDSPTCGGPVSFQFSIDQSVVGTASLRDGETSAAYPTTPGPHAVRAAFVGGSFTHDTIATLRAGGTFVHVLSPYCS